MKRRPAQRGYILLPVVLALTLAATAAYLINRDSAMDARIAGGQKEADEARYVAEAGLNHLLWKLRQSGGPYQNLPSTRFGAHSYSATVTPLTGSPVTIVATATMANGTTRTLRRDNIAVTCTVILQPAAEGLDATLNQQQDTRNFGAANTLLVTSGTSGGGGMGMGGEGMGGGGGSINGANTLLKFDLSSIPSGATLTSATLQLYLEGMAPAGTLQISAYRVTRAWVEGTQNGGGSSPNGATWATYNGATSWTNAGGDHDVSAAALTTVSATPGWYAWNAATLVSGWLTTPVSNNGMLLAAPSGGASNTATFTSSDAGGGSAGQRPKLTLVYPSPCN
jgi:hypothetical protein